MDFLTEKSKNFSVIRKIKTRLHFIQAQTLIFLRSKDDSFYLFPKIHKCFQKNYSSLGKERAENNPEPLRVSRFGVNRTLFWFIQKLALWAQTSIFPEVRMAPLFFS